MKILFIGNFQQGPGGEPADETHIARELERAGNEVVRVNRDEWREYVIEDQPKDKYKVPQDTKFDFCLIAKWHHFFDGSFIKTAREKYSCPVLYWVWDNMEGNSVGDWHMNMAQEADLYLSGELGRAQFYRDNGVRFYYFQFDCVDGDIPVYLNVPDSMKKYDVVYLGSCTNQNGRLDVLKAINKEVKIVVFGHDYEQWIKEGFEAHPAVYGADANRIISLSRIILGTSAGPNIYGYWSNRVGRVIFAGGLLLQLYAPGMEQFVYPAMFFNGAAEAVRKINAVLKNPEIKEMFYKHMTIETRDRWTSAFRVAQLMQFVDRYLKTNGGKEWQLP